MAVIVVKKKAVKVSRTAKKVVKKRTKKKTVSKDAAQPLLPESGEIVLPRNLIMILRRHLDVMSSFAEWEEKLDPVGKCVKNCSALAFWRLSEVIAYCNGKDTGELICLRKCSCYSPFHDQAFGNGKIYSCQERPWIRVGKGTKKSPYYWECILCTTQRTYPDMKTKMKGPVGTWTTYKKRRPKWALYI